MRFQVLGPVTAYGETGPVVLRAPMQRLVLAVLLAADGQSVSIDRLADALWADRPPRSIDKAVPWHVHKLRRLLKPADRIDRTDHGYRLTVEPGELDAARFAQLRVRATEAAGEPPRVAELLRQALELWRGSAYGDLADNPVLRAKARRLDDLRLATLAQRIDADLATGRHAELVGELSALVDEHGTREGYRGQLMLALYRCGRQADALQVYRDGRERLVEELGIEPGPHLRELEQAILRNDPVLEPPPPRRVSRPARAGLPSPAELPPDLTGFAGRDAEADQLDSVLAGESSTQGRIPVVTGGGGVGKSTLAVRVAHRVAWRYPDGQLYVNLHGATPGMGHLDPRDVLLRFLRSLGDPNPSTAADVSELAGRFRTATRDRRLLLVLDDAYDAAQVRPLLPAKTCGVLITSRRNLAAIDGAVHVPLGELPHSQAIRLLSLQVGADRVALEPQAVSWLVECCAGMPLALSICAARLKARPRWTIADLVQRLQVSERRLSELVLDDRAVRTSLMVGYRDLTDPDAARLFRLLGSHVGGDVGIAAAATLAGLDAGRASELLEDLVDYRLLDSPAPCRYRMHDLLRQFARELSRDTDAAADRHAAIRHHLHHYLATARVCAGVQVPAMAARLELPPRDLEVPGSALTSNAEAEAWFVTELDNLLAAARTAVSPEVDEPDIAVALSMAVSPVLARRGNWTHELRLAELIAPIAGHIDDGRVRMLCHRDIGRAYRHQGRLDEAITHLHRALELAEELGERDWYLSGLYLLGCAYSDDRRHEEAIEFLRRGLDLSRELGDRLTETSSLIDLGVVYRETGRLDPALEMLAQAETVSKDSGEQRNLAETRFEIALVHRRAHRPEQAAQYLEDALALSREAGYAGTLDEAKYLWQLGSASDDLGEHRRARECRNRSAVVLRRLALITDDEKQAIETAVDPPEPTALR